MSLTVAVPSLGRRQVQLWWLSASSVDPDADDILNDAERHRLASFARPDDRLRFLSAALLLRHVAGGHTGQPPAAVQVVRRCPNCSRPHGKPVLPGAGLHVSLSHSGDRVLLAATREGQVGVDVEQVVRVHDAIRLAPLVLAPEEELPTSGPGRAAAFSRYWVRKESLVKATGHGLRVPLSRIVVSRFDTPAELMRWGSCPPRSVVISDVDAGFRYRAAVSVLAAAPLEFTVHTASSRLHAPTGLQAA